MTKLQLNNLSIVRSKKALINDFSHSFGDGRIIALVGDNGSGKTTLLKTLAGLIRAEHDQILIDGQDINSLSRQIRAIHISFLLQHSPDQPYCTAKSRIAHGLMPLFGYDFFLDEKTETMIDTMARRLNIQHLLHRMLSRMSGGEQRLVHIAKCLINPSSKILLLDEPSVFLDFTQQTNLAKNLKEQAEQGRLVIFSSHDAGFIEQCADGIIRIHQHRAEVSSKKESNGFFF